MPRITKQKKELTETKVFPFYLRRPDTQKKYDTVCGLLDSVLKTRSNNKQRKENYIKKLQNCFQVLACHSTDLLESREKMKVAQKEIARQNDLRSECQDLVLVLQRQLIEASEFKARFKQERESKLKSEVFVGKNLRTITSLEKKIQELKTKNEKLIKKLSNDC